MEEENQQPNNLLNNKDVKVLHTYTSDMADAVRFNEASVIKIALAEKAKREQEEMYKKASGTPMSKIMLTLGGIILIAASIFAGYFVIQKNKEANIAPQVVKEIEAPISYDDKVFIDTTNIKTQVGLSDALKIEIEKTSKPGFIKAIFLTRIANGKSELLPISNFLSLLDISAPQALIRNMSESYMIGTYQSSEGESSNIDNTKKAHLFLLFKTKDYNQSYASMLSWEKTLLTDMFPPFSIDVSNERSELLEKPWSDIVINNKDARILYDNINKSVLYYIFPNKETFVITDSQDTIKEISARLIARLTKPL